VNFNEQRVQTSVIFACELPDGLKKPHGELPKNSEFVKEKSELFGVFRVTFHMVQSEQ
jgi:hypothetical protein